MKWLEEQPVKGRKSLWMDSAQRAIKSICFGPMGTVVNNNKQSNLTTLLENNVILELDRLTNADKTLIIESMLLWIHHFRIGEPDRETFKHALILEEAHHILSRTTGKETIIETVIREIRELGEAIILVDQHPSMISPIALGNTYTTICLNLKHKSDINAMGSAMLLDNNERDLLGILPIGNAVVKLQGRWPQPFQINIPHQSINKGVITDQKLTHIMEEQNAAEILGITNDEPLGPTEITLSEKEENFLKDIIKFPFAGVVERYKRLLLSRRKGNTIKEQLINKKLITTTEIPTRTGKTVLLEPTQLGTRLMQERGHKLKNSKSPESLIHKYWKEKAKKHYQKQGYSVLIEEPINGYTDLIIQKNNKRIAVEIETGKSNWKKNIQKNQEKGIQKIIIITTNDKTYQKIRETIQNENLMSDIKIQRAQEIL
jgi:hypothetical protein